MRQETTFDNGQGIYLDSTEANRGAWLDKLAAAGGQLPRQTVIGLIMVVALLAFELFNFDTTQYALRNLLGDVRFLGLGWATILAIAFCSIDFAGLVHLFTPEQGADEPKEVWYLMGAWLLGATMNALMTWWAVSLTLLNHDLGNEILSRGELLQIAPVFVAVLVWLTRILFIGAFSVAGEHLFRSEAASRSTPLARPALSSPARPATATARPAYAAAEGRTPRPQPKPQPVRSAPVRQPNSGRVRQRPPQPGLNRRMPAGMVAKGRRR